VYGVGCQLLWAEYAVLNWIGGLLLTLWLLTTDLYNEWRLPPRLRAKLLWWKWGWKVKRSRMMTWLGEGRRKFGAHVLAWFSANSALLLLAWQREVSFEWGWLLHGYALNLFYLVYIETQESRAGWQDGEKAVLDFVSKNLGAGLAYLVAGVMWA
jgi:hypothetical protein